MKINEKCINVPQKPGLYFYRLNEYDYFCGIVKIKGNIPFLEIEKKMITENILDEDEDNEIIEFSNEIKIPEIYDNTLPF